MSKPVTLELEGLGIVAPLAVMTVWLPCRRSAPSLARFLPHPQAVLDGGGGPPTRGRAGAAEQSRVGALTQGGILQVPGKRDHDGSMASLRIGAQLNTCRG
jgi:hypothetical protein